MAGVNGMRRAEGAEEGEEEDSETGKRDREGKERDSVWDRQASLGQCNEAPCSERLQVKNRIYYAMWDLWSCQCPGSRRKGFDCASLIILS